MIREMILLLKRGYLERAYFQDKFGVDIVEHWPNEWKQLVNDGYLSIGEEKIELNREGLLRVDSLLPAFFEPQHRGVRYT